jgi:hypothetical protein
MIQVNTIPKPEEGLNISKLVIGLNSASDSPFSMQFNVLGYGKRTIENDEGEEVDQWFPNPVYNGLFRVDQEKWSNWTPEVAGSDNEYIGNLVLADLNLEKAPEAEIEEVQVVTEEPVAEEPVAEVIEETPAE